MKITINSMAWLRLDELSEAHLELLKRELTLVQTVSPEYANRKKGPPVVIQCYVEDKENNRFGVPREFFFDSLTQLHEIEYQVSQGEPWPKRTEFSEEDKPEWAKFQSNDPYELTFVNSMPGEGKEILPVSLREEQQQAVDIAVEHLAKRPACGGIIQMPTGGGKTVAFLRLMKELRLKTAVVVHREFLANQWRQRIAQFMPDAKVGVIKGKDWETDDCHIVLIMVETIASWAKKKKIPKELADMFGLIGFDETHRIPSPLWSQVLPVFNAAKMIGISATPKRSDGLEKILWYGIGPKIFTGKALMMKPKLRRVWTNFKITSSPRFNPAFLSKEAVVKIMRKNTAYNKAVVEQICLAAKAGRRILVFSDVVEHLRDMHEQFKESWDGEEITVDYFIGGMTQDDLDIASEARIIFATYKMAAEGMDIPALDTAVLATPIRGIEQVVGRILRQYEGKKDPIIVDMRCDEVKICKEYAESRDRHYEKLYGIINDKK
jgi:superfamily II DNA or RNA helicase